MSQYLKDAVTNPRHTHQSEAIPGRAGMTPNSAGGYSFKVDDFERLRRFLILGAEGGSYYASEQKLAKDNAEVVLRCLSQDGQRTVDEIVDISTNGRAAKNDIAIFALALATVPQHADQATRKAAFDAIPSVCRTGTHLFQFCDYVNGLRGWGRGLRQAIARWYGDKAVDQLGYQVVKYRQREGWSHRDVLRKAHPGSVEGGGGITSPEKARLYDWICRGEESDHAAFGEQPKIVDGFVLAQQAQSASEAADLVREYGLPREALQTEHAAALEVQDALIETGVPMTALVRNLGNYTKSGLLTPTSNATATVLKQLADDVQIQKSRIHPIQFLMALLTYASGRSLRGKGEWQPVPAIIDALDDGFYKAFGNVEPTGKRRMIALDVSGSMGAGLEQSLAAVRRGGGYYGYYGGYGGWVADVPGLTPRVAAAALSLVTLNTGDPTVSVAFTSDLTPLGLSRKQRIDDVCNQVSGLQFGSTDCAQPMIYALKKNIEVDAFEIYTDSETWYGNIHPVQALETYRAATGINAKLIVVGLVANDVSIADPNDPGMLDVVGFDANAPTVMSEFIQGRL